MDKLPNKMTEYQFSINIREFNYSSSSITQFEVDRERIKSRMKNNKFSQRESPERETDTDRERERERERQTDRHRF